MSTTMSPGDSENQSLRKINALTSSLTADVADGVTVNGLSAIDAKLPALSGGRIPVDIGSIGTVTVSNEVEVINSVGSPIPVSGTFWQATQPVSGTFWQATQPVSGPLTDAELRATSVPVTANAGTNLNTSALALETTASSIKTAVETLDNAISGNEMQVDIVSAPTLTVSDRGATGEATVSSFTDTSSAVLKGANANRKLLAIYNEGAGDLHILYGSGTASTTNYSRKIASGAYAEIEKYTGEVTGIFAAAGTARVTEIT